MSVSDALRIGYEAGPLSLFGPSDPAWSTDDPTRLRAGVLTIRKYLHAIDEDVFDTGSVLVRILKGRMVGYRLRIENDDVGKEAFLEPPTIPNLDVGRRQRCHAADGFGQRDDSFVARVLA